jgi:hypothetical protein
MKTLLAALTLLAGTAAFADDAKKDKDKQAQQQTQAQDGAQQGGTEGREQDQNEGGAQLGFEAQPEEDAEGTGGTGNAGSDTGTAPQSIDDGPAGRAGADTGGADRAGGKNHTGEPKSNSARPTGRVTPGTVADSPADQEIAGKRQQRQF